MVKSQPRKKSRSNGRILLRALLVNERAAVKCIRYLWEEALMEE